MDFAGGALEYLEHPCGAARVVLIRVHEVGVRCPHRGQIQGFGGHPVEIPHKLEAVGGAGLDHSLERDKLVFDNIPQPPPSSRPGIGEIHFHSILRQPFSSTLQFSRVHQYGAGYPHAGALGEQGGNVVLGGVRAHASLVPAGVIGIVDHAFFACLGQPIFHVSAQKLDLIPDQVVVVRIRRIVKRGDKHPHTCHSHLVHIHHYLGKPVSVHHIYQGIGFGQVEEKPVAVVIVACVVMV